ncbi:nuclear inhibitor of protein phosphatase-1 [Anaeramoeba flamelloides]|uniref:Nuclear inhibitor of protein phosphatase-1 n=1 Tax=Anaeramoeba flamelloides TaxID=1746091 RepID=A0ABQ8YGW7_9EUKA|nr:nuclear inhibitor of protein phosphatase-1 [Anaeramoeba flamelloides]
MNNPNLVFKTPSSSSQPALRFVSPKSISQKTQTNTSTTTTTTATTSTSLNESKNLQNTTSKPDQNSIAFISPNVRVNDQMKFTTPSSVTNNPNTTQQKIRRTLPYYSVPEWSGFPKNNWFLEVIKAGKVVEKIMLNGSEFYTIGRSEDADITMLNESISRRHAIIQHSKQGKIYLYDLGSTHGSFVNKQNISKKTYFQLKHNNFLTFGVSTRKLVLYSEEKEKTTREKEKKTIDEKQKKQFKNSLKSKQQRHKLRELIYGEIDYNLNEGKKDETYQEIVERKSKLLDLYNDDDDDDFEDEYFDRTKNRKRQRKFDKK